MITEFIISAFLWLGDALLFTLSNLLPSAFVAETFPTAFTTIFTPVLFFEGVLPLGTMFSLLIYLLTWQTIIFFWHMTHWGIRKIPTVS